MDDIHVMEFARYLSYLEPMPPITKELDKWGSRYRSQKIHMIIWANGQQYSGKGKDGYGREQANSSAKVMYNRFLNPGGILWLAEALGEKESILRAAVAEAIKAEEKDYRNRCFAFRQVIPWSRIMQLYADWESWRFDKRLKSMIEIDYKSGYPAIKRSAKGRYIKVLDEEENGKQPPPRKLTEEEIRAAGIE